MYREYIFFKAISLDIYNCNTIKLIHEHDFILNGTIQCNDKTKILLKGPQFNFDRGY